MRNHWRPSTLKLFGQILACKHELTGELAAASKLGEIWEYSNTEAQCLVSSTNAANKVAKLLKSANFEPISRGEETLFRFPVDPYLDEVVKILKIKKNRHSMVKILNAFGIPKKEKK